jgi:iron complex outermembrane receptor protein
MPGNFQLHLDYDLGWAKVTSISGYVIGSETDSDLPNGDYANQDVVAHSHDVTEEVRLAGKDTANHQGGIQWVAGAYYLNGNASRFYSNLGPPTVYTALPVRSTAGFGQGSIGLTDFLRLTLGARYTSDKKGLESPGVATLNTQSDNFSYRAGLEADLSSQNLLYATVATGYVAGGINGGNPALPVPAADAQTYFQPETNKAYEVGSKNRFFDQRLQLNADLYHYSFKHYQVFSPAGFNDAPPPQQAISNIGDVTTYGLEFDGAWAVSPDDRLTASVTLAHGTYGAISYPAFAGAPGNFVPSLVTAPPGSRLINLPKVESFLGYDHTFRLSGSQVLNAAVNTHFSSNYALVPGSTDPDDTQKSYHKTNVSLTYKPDEKWSVQLWVENIEDTPVNIYGESPGFRLYSILPPRTFGVTLTTKF